MKRLLLFALFFVSFSHATTSVTGKIQTLGTGNITSGAFARFWLRGCGGNQPRINGTATIGPSQGGVFYFDISADSGGNVTGTIYSTRDATGLLGGEIECGGSKLSVWYGLQIFVAGKGGPESPVHAKNSATLDITQVTPITTTPVVPSPTGDSTYARLDGGNQPFTGNISPSGNGTLNMGTSTNRWKLFVSTLDVSGNSTLGGTLGVTGATTISSTLVVTGNTTSGSVTTAVINAPSSSALTLTGASTTGTPPAVTLNGGAQSASAGVGGAFNINGGAAGASSGTGGDVTLTGGPSASGVGGAVNLSAGSGIGLGAVNIQSPATLTNTITRYNGILTAGNGASIPYFQDDQIALVATRGPITTLTGTATSGGHWRLCYAEEVTTADASGRTITFSANFTSHAVARVFTGSAIAVVSTANSERNCIAMNVDNSTNATYTVTSSGAFTTAQYAVDVWMAKE